MRRSVLILVCAVARCRGSARSRRVTRRARARLPPSSSPRRGTRRCRPISRSTGSCRTCPARPPARADRILPSSRDSPRARARLPTRTLRRDCRSSTDWICSTTPLADYARYYTGVALAGLSRFAEADAVFTAMLASARDGYLKEAVPLRAAEVALARQDAARAEAILRRLVAEDLSVPEDALLALAQVEETLGHREHALETYRRIYYDSPLSQQAVDAQVGIERLQSSSVISSDLVARAQRRAQRLFDARRWAQARAGFEADRQGRRGRQPRPRGAADRRMRLLPRSESCGARRVEAVPEGFIVGRPRRATSISARFESWAIGRPTSRLRASSSLTFRRANGPPRR